MLKCHFYCSWLDANHLALSVHICSKGKRHQLPVPGVRDSARGRACTPASRVWSRESEPISLRAGLRCIFNRSLDSGRDASGPGGRAGSLMGSIDKSRYNPIQKGILISLLFDI